MSIEQVKELIAEQLATVKSAEERFAVAEELLKPFDVEDLYERLAVADPENVILVENVISVDDMIENQMEQGFEKALSLLKEGYFIARKGWNGKGMYLYLTEGKRITAGDIKTDSLRIVAENEQAQEVTILPHVDMRAADGSIVIGWLASQSDMLAEDWIIVSKGNSGAYFSEEGQDNE